MMNESIRTWLMRLWMVIGFIFIAVGLVRLHWVNPNEWTFLLWGCGILAAMTIVGVIEVVSARRLASKSCADCACKTEKK